MEQKDYKLEIVGKLIGTRLHARELAKLLKTNHTTIIRKLNELVKENVLDFEQIGRNKVFFLKKTSEARGYVYMAEQYKLQHVIITYPILREIIERIQGNSKIKLAVLFGSYAKGIAKKDSDIDIYIEIHDKKIKATLESLNSNLNIKIGKYNKDNLLIKEIEKNHVIIKGVERFYEGYKLFEEK